MLIYFVTNIEKPTWLKHRDSVSYRTVDFFHLFLDEIGFCPCEKLLSHMTLKLTGWSLDQSTYRWAKNSPCRIGKSHPRGKNSTRDSASLVPG